MPDALALATTFARKAKAAGGRALLVGGAVRNGVFGHGTDDVDMEVHGLAAEEVEKLARQCGTVHERGKAFGILAIVDASGAEIEVALPRRDAKISAGHTGFDVHVDPHMGLPDAAQRRDFTMNAVYKDPLTGEVFDSVGGVTDAEKRLLRVVDERKFAEDPLRLLRGAQLAARFQLRVADPGTLAALRGTASGLAELSKERVWQEWRKLLLAPAPSYGLTLLRNAAVLARTYPELHALIGVEQNPEWHPEGDVWTHTMLVVDVCAEVCTRERVSEDDRVTLVAAALCHDLGKPAVSRMEGGVIRAKGHEEAGIQPTAAFLERIGMPDHMRPSIAPIVANHLWATVQYDAELRGRKVTDGAFRRLSRRLAPATIGQLLIVAEADKRGRGDELYAQPFRAATWALGRSGALGVAVKPAEHVVRGQDLVDAGYAPGRSLGEIIAAADELHDAHETPRDAILSTIHSMAPDGEAAATALRALAHDGRA